MPLHLLGKKSWNVYNADNIARVRQDEAAAKAAEEAEEQRMQEVDAQRRLAILRGEAPPPLEDAATQDGDSFAPSFGVRDRGGQRRKRKRYGEDDTDFELRLAKDRDDPARNTEQPTRKPNSAPITDHTGHIDLLGDERLRAHAEKNEDAEKEAFKKKREFEDQYTMRFSNAAGRNGPKDPWYSKSDASRDYAPMKDVFGNDDPARRQRDAARVAGDDPLAMMRKGASKIKELKQERKKFQDERQEELKSMRREERRRRHSRREDKHRRRKSRSRSRSPSRRRPSARHRDDTNSGHCSRHDEEDGRRSGSRRSRSPTRRGSRLEN